MSSPLTHTRHRPFSAALRLCASWLWLIAAPVQAAPCEPEPVARTDATSGQELLERARSLAAAQKYGRARSLYAALISRKQEEREARLGMARLDGWEQCYERAETTYRSWLETSPRDVEARAGLIDVLLWTERWDDAQREIDGALQQDPEASELLIRRATLYFRRGDAVAALRATQEALKNAPTNAELLAMRDRLFFNQLRAHLRLDQYLGGYPEIYSGALSYWRRLNRVELSLDALFVERRGGTLPKAIFDAQYTAGASYHFGPLATLGTVGGLGAPHNAMPRWLGKLWLYSQWTTRWSTTLSYSLWNYTGDKTVHIFTPTLTWNPTEKYSLEARYYGTWLVLRDSKRFSSTISLRGVVQLLADLRVGLSYTYGLQLDQASLSDIIDMRSHLAAVFAEYRVNRTWGLQPFLSLERRAIHDRAIWIASVELGAYVRW